MRRKVTGEVFPSSAAVSAPPRNVLSPLNPRARQSGLVGPSGLNPQGVGAGQQGGKQQQLKALSINKKP